MKWAAADAQVQKSASHYTEAARDEITLLTQIRDGDPSDSRHCVRLHDWFEHRGPHGLHICMVFEVCRIPSVMTWPANSLDMEKLEIEALTPDSHQRKGCCSCKE